MAQMTSPIANPITWRHWTITTPLSSALCVMAVAEELWENSLTRVKRKECEDIRSREKNSEREAFVKIIGIKICIGIMILSHGGN